MVITYMFLATNFLPIIIVYDWYGEVFNPALTSVLYLEVAPYLECPSQGVPLYTMWISIHYECDIIMNNKEQNVREVAWLQARLSFQIASLHWI